MYKFLLVLQCDGKDFLRRNPADRNPDLMQRVFYRRVAVNSLLPDICSDRSGFQH